MEGAEQEVDIPSVVQEEVAVPEEPIPSTKSKEKSEEPTDEKAEIVESTVAENAQSDSHTRKSHLIAMSMPS